MKSNFATVWQLALISAMGLSGIPMMMLIGSIIGSQLAFTEAWATLPIAMMVTGTACGVLPAARCAQHLGRRLTFSLFIALGVIACLLLGKAVALQSFILFCAGAFGLGVMAAALQQIRFAAMESVPLDKAPTAASIIMCSGILAAIVGPEMALLGQHLSSVPYQGSFWLAAGCLLLASILLLSYSSATQQQTQTVIIRRGSRVLLKNPVMLLAIGSGASAFMVMSFIMTATPISMHLHQGHSMVDTKWVIQSHIAAMYLPSLVTPWLFRVLSVRGLMWAGLLCYLGTIIIGLNDASVLGYWGQLVMLGVGWNFLFVSGTALLPTTYVEGEQFKVQALNDGIVFSSQAAVSLIAGLAMSHTSWHMMLLLCVAPMLLMTALLWSQSRAV